jgi:hypothetical protein
MEHLKKLDYHGKCPICDRDMYDDGKSINRHHFIPKSRGGKEQEHCHKICHNKIHSLWTEKELELEFSDPEKIKENEEMKIFINWIKKKDPLFYISTKDSNQRKSKRRGR